MTCFALSNTENIHANSDWTARNIYDLEPLYLYDVCYLDRDLLTINYSSSLSTFYKLLLSF